MKIIKITFCLLLLTGLTSCKINLNIFGDDDDKVVSVSGNFDCTGAGGDCTQQYVNAIADCDGYDINDTAHDEWSELPNCTLVEAEQTHTDVLAAIPADGNEFAGWANFCWVGASFCKFEVTSENAASTSTAEVEANFGEVVQVQDAQYTYNHLGQRQSKTVNNVTTYFVYDADGLMIGEYNSTGATIREYVYLEGKLLAQYDYTQDAENPAQNYYINDHLGTPIIMMNREPEQTYDLETGPFGERYGEFKTAGTVQNIRFPGQYADIETGYSQNYFRDYDPTTGRYLQADPRGTLLDFSDPDRQVAAMMGIGIPASKGISYLNQSYNYVDSNPVNSVDSTGENTIVLGAEAGGAVGGPAGAVVGAVIGAGIGYYLGDKYFNNDASNDSNYTKSGRCRLQLVTDLTECEKICDPEQKKQCIDFAYKKFVSCMGRANGDSKK